MESLLTLFKAYNLVLLITPNRTVTFYMLAITEQNDRLNITESHIRCICKEDFFGSYLKIEFHQTTVVSNMHGIKLGVKC